MQLRALTEESVYKGKKAVNKYAKFKENMISFQRDMAMTRTTMHANGHIPDDSETQGKKTSYKCSE